MSPISDVAGDLADLANQFYEAVKRLLQGAAAAVGATGDLLKLLAQALPWLVGAGALLAALPWISGQVRRAKRG